MTHPLAKILAPFVKDHSELSVRQLSVLALLHDAKPKDRTVRALAATVGVSKPAITRAADRLTLEGLAKRIADQDDKRSVFIEITKTGERALAKALKAVGLTLPEVQATVPVKRSRASAPVLGASSGAALTEAVL